MCQKLYEGGYITYMRTDCAKYSKDFVEDSIKFIDHEYGARYKRESLSTIVLNDDTITSNNDKKNKQKDSNSLAQEAHEAIRPTNISTLTLPENYSTKEQHPLDPNPAAPTLRSVSCPTMANNWMSHDLLHPLTKAQHTF